MKCRHTPCRVIVAVPCMVGWATGVGTAATQPPATEAALVSGTIGSET